MFFFALQRLYIDSILFPNIQFFFWCYCHTQKHYRRVYHFTSVPQQHKPVRCHYFRRSSYWLDVCRLPVHLTATGITDDCRCQFTVHHCNRELLAANSTSSEHIYLSNNKELWIVDFPSVILWIFFLFGLWLNKTKDPLLSKNWMEVKLLQSVAKLVMYALRDPTINKEPKL